MKATVNAEDVLGVMQEAHHKMEHQLGIVHKSIVQLEAAIALERSCSTSQQLNQWDGTKLDVEGLKIYTRHSNIACGNIKRLGDTLTAKIHAIQEEMEKEDERGGNET